MLVCVAEDGLWVTEAGIVERIITRVNSGETCEWVAQRVIRFVVDEFVPVDWGHFRIGVEE